MKSFALHVTYFPLWPFWLSSYYNLPKGCALWCIVVKHWDRQASLVLIFGYLPGAPLIVAHFLAPSLVPPCVHVLAPSLVSPYAHFWLPHWCPLVLIFWLSPWCPLVFMFWLPPWCSLVLIFWLPPWCYTFYYLPAWHIWNKVVWLYSQTGTLGTVISPVKSIIWCWYLTLKSCLPWGGHAGWTYDLMCSNNILGLASGWSYTWWNRSWNSWFWSWKIVSWYCQYCFSSRLSMFC